MPTRRSLGTTLSILLVLAGACLSGLTGCNAGTELSDGEPKAELSQTDALLPDPEGQWSRHTPVKPDFPTAPSGSEPTGSDPWPGATDPTPSQPKVALDWPAFPAAPSDSPSSTVGGDPVATDLRKDLIRPGFVAPSPRSIPRVRVPVRTREIPTLPSGDPVRIAAPREARERSRPLAAESSRPMTVTPKAGAITPEAGTIRAEPLAIRTSAGTAAAVADESRPDVEPTSPVAESEAPAAVEADTEKGEEYAVVRVFYGTDRNAVEILASDGPGFAVWYALTVACAAITVILTLLAFRFARRPMMLVLAGGGLAATVALGVVTTLARLQGEPPGPRPNRSYGSQRGEMEMGTCEVSIPRGHEVGEVERPSVFRFEFREDPRRHVVLLGVEKQAGEAFFAALQARVEASRKKEAFVFVHGYNVSFDEAAQRTAQLAHDLKFDGAPIFFSWPSRGEMLQYAVDETNVVWAAPHLKEFLAGIAKRSNAEAVHVIAHSMGNRALVSALETLSREMRGELPLFREVVLAAPDIDAEVFRRDIVPAIVPTADRVTLYASSNDEALKLSKKVHGYRRAGDSGSQMLVVPGVDTIDVSSVDTSFLGHFYYGSNRSVITDMLDLINEAKPPQLRRWLEPRPLGHLTYWVFHGDPPTTVGASPLPGAPVRR